MDAAQTLKLQLGELVWSNSVLSAENTQLKDELEELKKEQKKDTNA